MDERRGEVSGQPGEVESLNIGQQCEDTPDLVERALWIQSHLLVDCERMDIHACPSITVEQQQCPRETFDMLCQAWISDQGGQKGALPHLHVRRNIVALQNVG